MYAGVTFRALSTQSRHWSLHGCDLRSTARHAAYNCAGTMCSAGEQTVSGRTKQYPASQRGICFAVCLRALVTE